jgi:hypothetical protein
MSDALEKFQQIRDRGKRIVASGQKQVDEGTEVVEAAEEMIAAIEGGVTDAEARRRRRGMHALALIPAGIAGRAVIAKQNPVASGVLALTASAILGAIVLMPPGHGNPHDTAPGVIAGPEAPAPTAPPERPESSREATPPVSLRPERPAPAPQAPPQTQTIDLELVRVPAPRRPVDVTPVTAQPEQMPMDMPRLACIRVQVPGAVAVRLCR